MDPPLFAAIRTGWYAFDKWYSLTDEVAAYAASLLLHPHRRKVYIQSNWKEEWIPKAIESARQLWETKYKNNAAVAVSPLEPTKEPDEFDLWERDQSIITQIDDEFESFITGDPIPIDKKEPALNWWLQETQQRTYPNLSQMAIDILSIPSISAEAERVFSDCRRTITWQRMRLGVKVAEEGECLKSWIRSSVIAGMRRLKDIEYLKAVVEASRD